jgi:hypothetical protein
MSSIVRADFFKEGYSATNQRNNEIVRLISKVNCTYEEIWIIEGEKGIYLEFQRNLENSYYYGD